MNSETGTTVKQQENGDLDYGEINLQELLGENWLERSVYSNMVVAFTSKELQALESKRIPTAENARTGVEMDALEINGTFNSKGGVYTAYVLECDGRQQLAVIGRVGEDVVYITRKPQELSSPIERLRGPIFTPDIFSVISATGGVWRIDRMVENKRYRLSLIDSNDGLQGLRRICRCHEEYDVTMDIATVVANLPYNDEDFGLLFHEIGHALLDRALARNNPTALEKYMDAYNKYGSVFSPNLYDGTSGDIDFPHAKEVVMTYEVEAWKIGMAILGEVGKAIGIDAGTNGMDAIRQTAFVALERHKAVESATP